MLRKVKSWFLGILKPGKKPTESSKKQPDSTHNKASTASTSSQTNGTKILGGPSRKAFGKKDIIPMNFTDGTDPFWDLAPKLNEVEKEARNGKTNVLIIIQRSDEGISTYWRGTKPLTAALGSLEFGKLQLYENGGE